MDPVAVFQALGFLGGVLFVVFLMRSQGRQQTGSSADPFRDRPTDVINVARIRVAGIGGLGLVAMALAVALDVPRIGRTLAIGLVLGAVFAAILIRRRRRHGPLPSSGQSAGANTTLSIDTPPESTDQTNGDSSSMTARRPSRRGPRNRSASDHRGRAAGALYVLSADTVLRISVRGVSHEEERIRRSKGSRGGAGPAAHGAAVASQPR